MPKFEHNDQDITATKENDNLVIFNLIRGEASKVNGVGQFIWENLPGKSEKEIADLVVESFSVDRSQAEKDVTDFINMLKDKALIVEKKN